MSLPIHIPKKEKCNTWMTVDLTDQADTLAVVVFPMFGPDHLTGPDCWCHPDVEPGLIIHQVAH